MNIPLINTNDKESINTSLIAIKRATEELNNLIKIADEKMAQLDEKAKKYTDDKINALDVDSVGGSGKYISAIEETDGKISATASNLDTTVTPSSTQPVTSGAVASAVDNIQYLRYGADISGSDEVDNLPSDKFCVKKVRNYAIGWANNDGFIVHIPWSNAYVKQIAIDDETGFMAIRGKIASTWGSWHILPNVDYDDSAVVDISSQMTMNLGLSTIVARRTNNMVYLQLFGVYTGQQTNSTQLFAYYLPEKYRPKTNMESFAILGYQASQFTTVGRMAVDTSGVINLQETAWLNGTQIRGEVIYFI